MGGDSIEIQAGHYARGTQMLAGVDRELKSDNLIL
jgi:hypothetical protein